MTDEEFKTRLIEHMTRADTVMGKIEERLDSHHNSLYGNGRPGVLTRVDRIEQTARAAKEKSDKDTRITMAVIAGVIMLFFETIWQKLTGH